ncbi:hypothetical protein [Roseobacter sp. HKCCD5988]|uniref:hypothetical protein n=1 Tax=Roseobacter sp. HKCCD5988 TaxID=3120338 RepID=UPI0030EB4837
MAKNDKIYSWEFFILLMALSLGVFLRFSLSALGYNVDIVNFWNTVNYIISGENLYAATDKYNYGPIWGYALAFFTKLLNITDINNFRILITSLLTIADAIICVIVSKKFGRYYGAFFFLNPISIFVSGYHGQFDNFAIMVGLLSVIIYSNSRSNSSFIIGLVFLGLSLSIKHILFMLPIWFFMSERNLFKKICFLLVPYGLFFISFIPFLPEGANGVITNVFAYRSFNNAPFWSFVVPYSLYVFVPKFILFLGSLFVCGFLLRRHSPLEIFLNYLALTLIFSSAVALQYLVIPVLFLIIYWNTWFIFYLVIASATYMAHNDGISLVVLRDYVGWNGRFGIHLSVLAFGIGYLMSKVRKDQLRMYGKIIVDNSRKLFID